MFFTDFLNSEVKKLNDLFKGSFLNKIQAITSCDYLFGFSKNGNNSLFVSLNIYNPFVETINQKITLNQSNAFLNKLKAKLQNAKFIEAKILNDDSIVSLEFLKTTDTYDHIYYFLIIELFKANSNLILVSDNKIVDCYRHKSLDTKHPLINGLIYQLPIKDNFSRPVTDKDIAFYHSYIQSIEERFLSEKYKPIIQIIKRKKKTFESKINNLISDKEEARKKLEYKNFADELLTNINNIKKGDTSFNFEGNEISLNPNFSPTENLEKFYKIYKKAKQTLVMIDQYIAQTKNDIDYLSSILDQISFFNQNDFEELILELKSSNIIKIKEKIPEKKISSALSPYYLIFNNVKIGFGKNNLQNDKLTFSLAPKDSYFLHINKNHGPHVIIFEKNPSNDVKEFASEIALYFAKQTDGDVMFTKIKNVKKTSTPGLVKVSNYETFHISHFKFDIQNFLKDLKRF